MREILLTQGQVAYVDDEDYEGLSRWQWYAMETNGIWYAMRTEKLPVKRTICMHTSVMKTPDGLEVDHEDGNGLNNQRYNLRVATHTQNLWNTGVRRSNTSGYKGVSWHQHTGKWRSEIRIGGGQRLYLGVFEDITDAARAYNEAALLHHGEFARLNRIEPV
jgi:hypothetical protein